MESKEEITKQYMKDTRFVWGTLWLQITTDINERNISQEKKWLSRRKIRKGIYAVGIVLLLFLCGISGREYYIRSYPQQYFTYKAKQKNDYYIPVSYTHLDVYKRQAQRYRITSRIS